MQLNKEHHRTTLTSVHERLTVSPMTPVWLRRRLTGNMDKAGHACAVPKNLQTSSSIVTIRSDNAVDMIFSQTPAKLSFSAELPL